MLERGNEKTAKNPNLVLNIRKVVLICGVLSSILYISAYIIASLLWDSYSYTSYTVSELMAIEAPTRSLMVILFTLYNILVISYGLGILTEKSQKRNLTIIGFLLIGYAVLGQIALLFFPMHIRGATETITRTDIMHIIFTGVMVIFLLLIIGFGAVTHRKWFCLYSIGTILIL